MLATLELFDTFGTYSGIHINWSKSVMFPLDSGARRMASASSLHWVDKFRHLGVQVSWDLTAFTVKNVYPLLLLLREQGASWANLPLSFLGHINLIKMMILPKFTYVFRKLPSVGSDFLLSGDRQLCEYVYLAWDPSLIVEIHPTTPNAHRPSSLLFIGGLLHSMLRSVWRLHFWALFWSSGI